MTNEHEELIIENVYEMMPPAGTIIAEATEEEMRIAGDLECRHLAFMRLQDMNMQVTGDSYQSLYKELLQFERDSHTFWKGVSERLGIPYEWPIRIDYGNGPIYIGDVGQSSEPLEEEY